MRASICFLVVVLLYTPFRASAQITAVPGDRVRIQAPGGTIVVGVIKSVSPEAIVVSRGPTGQELTLPFTEVGRIERSLGSQRRFARNFGLTVGVSAGAIGVVSAAAWSPCSSDCFLYPASRAEAFAIGAGGGALIGVPLGIIIGLAAGSERWEPVLAPGAGNASIALAPIVGPRLGISGSISFGGR